MTAPIGRVPESRIPIRALTRTFLRRFFASEITGGTQDRTASSFWLIGFLAAPLTLAPVDAMMRYRLIVLTHGPDALRILSRADKVVTVVLGMMAAAMISAIVWSSLMLERRDGLILGALPVRGRTVALSKLAAFGPVADFEHAHPPRWWLARLDTIRAVLAGRPPVAPRLAPDRHQRASRVDGQQEHDTL